MKEKFDVLLNEYLLDDSKKINADAKYHEKFINELPEYLYNIFPKENYKIKTSVGNGYRSFIPWACIFDKRITNSASRGFYIGYLFKKDMSGFYLTLMQGYTAFKKYKRNKYDYAFRVSRYFQTLINCYDFSLDRIALGGDGDLACGYEVSTIISKYYDKNNYTEEELLNDLTLMKNIYKQLADSYSEVDYDQLVDNIVNNFDTYVIDEEERQEIEKQLIESSGENSAIVRTLERVDFPSGRKKRTETRISDKRVRKIDYIKKAKKSIETGVAGEMLVLDYERDRLSNIGRDDLAHDVKWIANIDDSKGYDIESFDIDKEGNIRKIYIEVKTTDSSANSPFFISKNELEKVDNLKDNYYIYRVYEVQSVHPKIFVIEYNDIKKRLNIKPKLYKANILDIGND